MRKARGQVVGRLWVGCGFKRVFPQQHASAKTQMGKSWGLYPVLSNFCTQLVPTQNSFVTPVFSMFSALSTGPITTTTKYIKE